MRWVAAIAACLLIGLAGARLGISAAPSADAGSVDAEIIATFAADGAADTGR